MTQPPSFTEPGSELGEGSVGHREAVQPMHSAPVDDMPVMSAEELVLDDEAAASPFARYATALKVLCVVVVLGVGFVIGDIVVGKMAGSDEPAPTETVTAAVPTPADVAVDRGETTVFGSALPGEVRQFALSAFEPTAEWDISGATERFKLTYSGAISGAEGNQSAQVVVYAAQFRADAAAQAVYEARLAPTAPEIQSGQVSVGGGSVGDFVISTAESAGALPSVDGSTEVESGTARALWRNGTAVFEAYGPVSEIVNFYNAYAF